MRRTKFIKTNEGGDKQGAYNTLKEGYCNSFTLGVFAEDRSELLRSCRTIGDIMFYFGDIIIIIIYYEIVQEVQHIYKI